MYVFAALRSEDVSRTLPLSYNAWDDRRKKFVIENELQKDDAVGGKQGFLRPNGRGVQYVTSKSKSMNIISPT